MLLFSMKGQKNSSTVSVQFKEEKKLEVFILYFFYPFFLNTHYDVDNFWHEFQSR